MKHKTKNGRAMLIAEMEDSHLKNTVNLLIENMRKAKSFLRATGSPDDFSIALYGEGYMNKNTARQIVENFQEKVSKYLFEMHLRSMPTGQILDKIRDLLERKHQKATLYLEEHFDSELDDIEEDL